MAFTSHFANALNKRYHLDTFEIYDAGVLNAARRLIARHRAGESFDIEALDIPHRAFLAISEKLDTLGYNHVLSKPLAESLRRYVMESGGAFARAVKAKPVMIRMVVASEMPACHFQDGMTELACLGTSDIKIEGSSTINVRATPTGTATTSNAANVDAMFANVKGLHLWIRFESPTREEMDSLLGTMEDSLAMVIQSLGGAMSADDLKELIERLELEGVLTPAVLDLLNKVITLQEGIKSGVLTGDDLTTALDDIGALMADIQSANLAPDSLMQAILSTISSFPVSTALLAFLTEQGFQNMLADNDNAPAAENTALEVAEEFVVLLEDMASILKTGEIMIDDIAPEIMALMDELGGIESLLNKESHPVYAEKLADQLQVSADDTTAEIIYSAIIGFTDASINSLPPSISLKVQKFIKDHPVLLEEAVTSTILSQMNASFLKIDPQSDDAVSLASIIGIIQKDGFTALLNSSTEPLLSLQAVEILQAFEQDHPVAVNMMVDIKTIDTQIEEAVVTAEPELIKEVAPDNKPELPQHDKNPDNIDDTIEEDQRTITGHVLDCCKDLKLPPSSDSYEDRQAIQNIFTQQWGADGGKGPTSIAFEYNADTNEVAIFDDGIETTIAYDDFLKKVDDYAEAIKQKDDFEIREADLENFPPSPPKIDFDDLHIKPQFETATDPFQWDGPDFAIPSADSMDDAFGFSDFEMK
jgi:hypothetical protein